MEGLLMDILQQQLWNTRESVRWAGRYEPHSSFAASAEQEGSRIAGLVELCKRPLGRRWRGGCLQQNVRRIKR